MLYSNEAGNLMPTKELAIVTNDSGELTIDARQLHEQLKVPTLFKDWIKRRIQEFGFKDGEDFSSNLSESTGGRKAINYYITLDMAKELAMVERTEIGKIIRRYFIAVEKEARRNYPGSLLIPARIHSREVNGRKVYPFAKLAKSLGYKSGGSLYYRRNTYPNHFIKIDRIWHVTEEMKQLMQISRSATVHRETIKKMQPILPLDFGAPIQIGG